MKKHPSFEHFHYTISVILCPIFGVHRIFNRIQLCVIENGIALSMHPWQGQKQPRSCEFAALTIVPHRSVVISPCQRDRLSLSGDRSSSSVIPFRVISPCKYSSCTCKNSSDTGSGIRILKSERRSFFCSSAFAGICISAYFGCSLSNALIKKILLSV